MLLKTCRKCRVPKPVEEFHRKRAGLFGRDSICKLCSKVKTEGWRAKNPGALRLAKEHRSPASVKAAQDRWRAKHGLAYERARYIRRQGDPAQKAVYRAGQQAAKNRRRAAGELTAATVREVLKAPCAYCGGKATSIDHVLPVSRGGTNTRENLAPACADCNRRKHAKTPAEWKGAARAAQ